MADRPVVVITGASSGIGRATARAFARERARLVLASRDEAELATIAQQCRTAPTDAFALATDVTDYPSVEALAEFAVNSFGRIDVWVNCAGVLLLGPFEEIPLASFKRVIETNLYGYVHGAHASLAQFRMQDDSGTLINVGSVLGVVGEPQASAYVASKFAIRGFTASLREELRATPGIKVCAVLPSAMDTPIYRHAGNYAGQRARSIFPPYDPHRVATAIVRLSKHPRAEIIVGNFGRLLTWAYRVAPVTTERLVGRFAPRLQFQTTAAAPDDGNLFTATPGPDTVSGGWRRYWFRTLTFRRGDDR
jgi:short-subunit dehydrogenase